MRSVRAFLHSLDPDEKAGTGAVALDLAHAKFFRGQLDQIPGRGTFEKSRTFGIYKGKHVSIPFVGSGDYSTAQIGQLVAGMINMSYGRDDELESDALGVRIAAEAGYDPRAMIRVMEVLAQASGGSRQPEFVSTHPAPENRAARIREEIAKQFPGGPPKGLVP